MRVTKVANLLEMPVALLPSAITSAMETTAMIKAYYRTRAAYSTREDLAAACIIEFIFIPFRLRFDGKTGGLALCPPDAGRQCRGCSDHVHFLFPPYATLLTGASCKASAYARNKGSERAANAGSAVTERQHQRNGNHRDDQGV